MKLLCLKLISKTKRSDGVGRRSYRDIKLTLSQQNVLIALETITESRVIKHDTDACQDSVVFRHYRH